VYAQPVDSWVHEVRYGIYDGNMADFDVEDIKPIVAEAHRQWKAGRRVLIRCQAGWNRSGLIMALVLMWEGFSAEQAITLIRRARGEYAMGNSTFETWLKELDIQVWKS
jgi:protein-tyrosine phosphatase